MSNTRTDQILAAKAKRTNTVAAMAKLLDKVELERRDLSRIERTTYTKLERDLERLDSELRQMRADFDPRLAQGGATLDAQAGDVILNPEHRLADWVREHRGGNILDGIDEGQRFSLGALLQANVTGDHRHLTDLERRALAEGADATGGVLVPEELSSRIIDRARAKAVIFQAGAVTAPMSSDTLVLARLAGGNTANWKNENAAVSESDQNWERVELKAKTVVVLQKLSRELFEDLSDEGRRAIENEIAQAIALKLDLAALEGSGAAPEPRGIANTTGLNSISMGTNGLKPTSFDQVVQAFYSVKKANGSDPTAAILHPRDAETYALLKDTTNQPLRRPPAIEALPFLDSSQLSVTRTQGTSTDASNAYVGDFTQLIVGLRPALQIRVQLLEERFADNLQVAVLAWLRGDVAVAHPEHFTKIVGIRNV